MARAHGFVDPIALLARLHQFAQPSEVAEPIELLRAGVVLHARGLINSRVIQHNLDWVWPYWVECQFDPQNEAFVPRAFSITHINLTHRNWTAIGLPDFPQLPIVDPRGLVTPLFDKWSLDAWIFTEDGRLLLPSRCKSSVQRLDLAEFPSVITQTDQEGLSLLTSAHVESEGGRTVCRVRMIGLAESQAWAVFALRPYNPEGISFVHRVSLSADRRTWTINKRKVVRFSDPADGHAVSRYSEGDVCIHLKDLENQKSVTCDVGMATAAALFKLAPGQSREIIATIPLEKAGAATGLAGKPWRQSLKGCCALHVPDKTFQFLYDAALRTLILHAPHEVYPGPFTYKRFWFRDAAFILHALVCVGLFDRAERALDLFPGRQTALGYFRSQNGEWDSNGEALWIMGRFCKLSGRPLKTRWRKAVFRGARWIRHKRLSDDDDNGHRGLLPPGFSAEHLGPNDYYYWDDFWGVAGLEAAAGLAESIGDLEAGEVFEREAKSFWRAIERSLALVSERLGRQAIPASPYRRLDAGAIGSLAVGYPLKICSPDDARLLDTVHFLLSNCLIKGGFFQDMVHSGINAYLSLHIAQVLLRAGNPRYLELMDAVAGLASPTGQWPEAIHPRTGGGCMGDGQHVWAAAEWVLMIRNCFVREEGNGLILASGIPRTWLGQGNGISFGPAPTSFGSISLSIDCRPSRGQDKVIISWQGAWHDRAPQIEVRLPGHGPVVAEPGAHTLELGGGLGG